MTWGNFQRAALGYQKRTWKVSREILAAIISSKGNRITGEDIFPFGNPESAPVELPNREYMDMRYEHLKKLKSGIC